MIYVILILILVVLNFVTYVKFKFINKEKTYLANELQTKNQQIIDGIKVVANLEAEVRYLSKLHEDSKILQQSYLDAAKVTLLETSSVLNKQLIEAHKIESEQAKKILEENVIKYNHEFIKITNIITTLNNQVDSSLKSVDLIKDALLNPIATGQLLEMTLENILVNSGLQKDIDFRIQPHFQTNNQISRPDAIVMLPNNNLIVIDAKASVVAMDIDDSDNGTIDNFIKSMYQQLKSLSSKEYYSTITHAQDYLGYKCLYTLMFVQTDVLLSKITKYANRFIEDCAKSNIYIVGPTGLLNILTLAKIQIKEVQCYKNYDQIIGEINKLIDTINILTEHGNRFGNSLQSLVAQYDKFAGSFNRTFINKLKHMKQFGIGSNNVAQPLKRYQLLSSAEIINSDIENLLE